jgi:hypothetical protein
MRVAMRGFFPVFYLFLGVVYTFWRACFIGFEGIVGGIFIDFYGFDTVLIRL